MSHAHLTEFRDVVGVHSYDIHLKQCKDLWIARENQKPKRERKPLPADPMLALGRARDSPENEGAMDIRPSPLRREPSVKGAGMSNADIAAMNAAAQETYNNVSLAKCEWCGRSFLAEKLAIHNRSCTQDNPARRVTDSVKRGNSINSRELSSPPPERPKTSSSAAPRERKHARSREAERLGSTSVPNGSTPSTGSPLAGVSPLVARRGVTRIEPSAPDPIVSEDEYSDAYKSSQLGSPLRGSSSRSLRNKQLSPNKGEPDMPESKHYNSNTNSSSSGSELDNQALNSAGRKMPRTNSMEKTQQVNTGNKAETIRYLAQRMGDLEQHAVSLVQAVGEIKDLLRQLQN